MPTLSPADKMPFPRRAIEALLDIFFPRNCLVTGKFPDDERYRFLSKEGREKLTTIDTDGCPNCGAPRGGEGLVYGECVFCRDRKFAFDRSRSAVIFNAPARALVHAVKYHGVCAAVSDLAAIATEPFAFFQHLENATLVPVPLFRTQKNRRGYNQSLLLANELAKRVPSARVEDLLERTRDTGTQTRLGAEDRRRNVRHAFSVPKKLRGKISAGTRYVVIDDVFTTGSTLSECALALKKAGAETVDAATFAHG